ncbi:hypothetical protein IKQ26_05890 [bacterium]|nr:hypothetical protein [bacterium]
MEVVLKFKGVIETPDEKMKEVFSRPLMNNADDKTLQDAIAEESNLGVLNYLETLEYKYDSVVVSATHQPKIKFFGKKEEVEKQILEYCNSLDTGNLKDAVLTGYTQIVEIDSRDGKERTWEIYYELPEKENKKNNKAHNDYER